MKKHERSSSRDLARLSPLKTRTSISNHDDHDDDDDDIFEPKRFKRETSTFNGSSSDQQQNYPSDITSLIPNLYRGFLSSKVFLNVMEKWLSIETWWLLQFVCKTPHIREYLGKELGLVLAPHSYGPVKNFDCLPLKRVIEPSGLISFAMIDTIQAQISSTLTQKLVGGETPTDKWKLWRLVSQSIDIKQWLVNHHYIQETSALSYMACGASQELIRQQIAFLNEKLSEDTCSSANVAVAVADSDSDYDELYPVSVSIGKIIDPPSSESTTTSKFNSRTKRVQPLPVANGINYAILAVRFNNLKLLQDILNDTFLYSWTEHHQEAEASLMREAIVQDHPEAAQMIHRHYYMNWLKRNYPSIHWTPLMITTSSTSLIDRNELQYRKSNCNWTEEQPIVHNSGEQCSQCEEQGYNSDDSDVSHNNNNDNDAGNMNLWYLACRYDSVKILEWLVITLGVESLHVSELEQCIHDSIDNGKHKTFQWFFGIGFHKLTQQQQRHLQQERYIHFLWVTCGDLSLIKWAVEVQNLHMKPVLLNRSEDIDFHQSESTWVSDDSATQGFSVPQSQDNLTLVNRFDGDNVYQEVFKSCISKKTASYEVFQYFIDVAKIPFNPRLHNWFSLVKQRTVIWWTSRDIRLLDWLLEQNVCYNGELHHEDDQKIIAWIKRHNLSSSSTPYELTSLNQIALVHQLWKLPYDPKTLIARVVELYQKQCLPTRQTLSINDQTDYDYIMHNMIYPFMADFHMVQESLNSK
jgi:hypothetical protein